MKTGIVLLVSLLIFGILLILGIREKRRNDWNIDSIPIRVHVNGSSGKTSVTRLITGILNEAGYNTIGITAGRADRMIYWDTEEKLVKRKPRGASLADQIRMIDEAAEHEAEALVCESRALQPEAQKIFQHEILDSTVTVIVNVEEKHLHHLGPTRKEIADAFAETIPYDGIAILPDCEYTDYFMKVAKERNTVGHIVYDSIIPEVFLSKFDYPLSEHTCAVALTFARAMGISDKISAKGMLKARPDPDAMVANKKESDKEK